MRDDECAKAKFIAEKVVTVRTLSLPMIKINADFYHSMVSFDETVIRELLASKSINHTSLQNFKTN